MRTLVLELNEFSFPLLEKAAHELDLQNVKKIINFHHSQSFTDDTYESDYLEPWVQWVSVHTGVPSSVHQIKHLGDVPNLTEKQVWERLSDQGVSTGVWGIMNGGKVNADLCHFFLPDPWSFCEKAYPENLNSLLLPLRYISKHYAKKRWGPLLSLFGQLSTFLKKEKSLGFLLKKIPSLLKNAIQHRFKPFVFISAFDELSVQLFLNQQKKSNPEVAFLFLNSIAHLMHHQWKQGPITKTSPLSHGFSSLDRMLNQIFQTFDPEKDLIIVMNALSQQNTNADVPWILYRQIDHKAFLKTAGIEPTIIEPHMTHDAHLFFSSENAANNAKRALENITILGKPLFEVESYPEEKNKLFYKIIFTSNLDKNVSYQCNGGNFPFFKYFKAIVQRTGKHIQTADVLSNQKLFPEKLYNHEILSVIEKVYQKPECSLQANLYHS